MADESKNPRLEKLVDGLYTLRDYQQPKAVDAAELRKLADEARKIHITITREDSDSESV